MNGNYGNGGTQRQINLGKQLPVRPGEPIPQHQPQQTQAYTNQQYAQPQYQQVPQCQPVFVQTEKKKPLWKRILSILGIVVLVFSAYSCGVVTGSMGSENAKPAPQPNVSTESVKGEEADVDDIPVDGGETPPTEGESTVPTEWRNALRSAENYSEFMHMSKQAIYEQLTSEYGDQFPAEAAQYAIDNLEANYNENALASARSYSEHMNMSQQAIYDQLTSEYGDRFTPEEAQYAIDHLND